MSAPDAAPPSRQVTQSDRKPNLTVLSLGAGVQSTTLALLAVEGVLPRPDFAVFADTGWEPKAVYDHLTRLTTVMEAAGIPVVTVTQGNLRDDVLNPDVPGVKIPVFIRSENTQEARGGLLSRQCTGTYKLDPIRRFIRRELGATLTIRKCRFCEGTGRRIVPQSKHDGENREGVCSVCRGTREGGRVGPAPKGRFAECWVGFSTDEIQRVSPSHVPYVVNTFPLLDLNMSRKDCERWLTARGWSTTKSACIGCPFHGNRAWRELRDNQPEEWQDAVAFDRDLRAMPGAANRRGAEAFLHSSRLPLDLAPIDTVTAKEWHENQSTLLDALAEEGDPDGCSPYGCRSGEPVTVSDEDAA